MRKLSILAFATVAALSFAGASQATPLGAAGTVAATTNAAVATDNGGVTEVRWRRGYRYYGWRHRHYGRALWLLSPPSPRRSRHHSLSNFANRRKKRPASQRAFLFCVVVPAYFQSRISTNLPAIAAAAAMAGDTRCVRPL